MTAVQGPPSPTTDLAPFPVEGVHAGQVMFRAHSAARGAWWFDNGPAGRFNLSGDRGTCCTASDIKTATRERVREHVTQLKVVDSVFADEFVVSRVTTPLSYVCAAVSHEDAADFGVVRELTTMDDYTVPQGWASAFDGADFDGVFYGSAFTTGDPSAYALFGDAGAPAASAGFTEAHDTDGADACRALGWTVGPPPTSSLTIIT